MQFKKEGLQWSRKFLQEINCLHVQEKCNQLCGNNIFLVAFSCGNCVASIFFFKLH
jgi:hypothetical protein